MAQFNVALDDYLHQIIRTRPWVKKREEELLIGFGEWLAARPGSDLASISPSLGRRYAVDEGLDEYECGELEIALQNFCLWADYAGLIPASALHAFQLQGPA